MSAALRRVAVVFVVAAAVAAAFPFVSAAPVRAAEVSDAARVTTTLAVRGNVATPLTLTVADLAKLPVLRVEDARVVRGEGGMGGTGGVGTTARQFAGCLLRDVLNAARLTEPARHDLRRTIVVATASDGYKAVFSWAELFNSPIGDGVLVVYERDGAPLPDAEGRIALVSLKDTRPGPRHVKWLASVDVVRVAD